MASPRLPPFGNHDVITISHGLVTSLVDLKGNTFGSTLYPVSLNAIALILPKLWRESRVGAESTLPKQKTTPKTTTTTTTTMTITKTKPGRNSVKVEAILIKDAKT